MHYRPTRNLDIATGPLVPSVTRFAKPVLPRGAGRVDPRTIRQRIDDVARGAGVSKTAVSFARSR